MDEKNKKVLEYIKNNNLCINNDNNEITVSFCINGEPKPYARERYTSIGKHFYNKRDSHMKDLKSLFKEQIRKDENYKHICDLVLDPDGKYHLIITGDFYIKIPKSASIKNSAEMESKIIRPIVHRGDIDNYIKLILDSLHDVVYDDDKRVVGIICNKYYSLEPRTEIKVRIVEY